MQNVVESEDSIFPGKPMDESGINAISPIFILFRDPREMKKEDWVNDAVCDSLTAYVCTRLTFREGVNFKFWVKFTFT